MSILLLSLSGYKKLFSYLSLRLFLISVMALLWGTAYAQNSSQVSGKVTDSSTGKALPGVNISVLGTTTGTVTNAKGNYKLNVPSRSDTLRFSYIGYSTKTVPINGRSKINIQLTPTQVSGKQLVVVGYSTQKKSNITTGVSEVSVKNMQAQPSSNVVNQLQGQASGVTVVSSGQPGESPNIRIRGINSFGNNNPLYVVDGVPTTNINDLNSDDIASMSILKGAAAASIYGARASNGVVLITTKKGQKGHVKIQYSAYGGFNVPPQGNVWNMGTPKQEAQIFWNAVKNSGGDVKSLNQYYDPNHPNGPRLPDYIDPAGAMNGDPATDPSKYHVIPNYTGGTAQLQTFYNIIKANKKGTDWFHSIFKTKPIMNQNINVSGGSDIGNYLVSLNYTDDEGALKNQYLKRYSLRVNTKFNATKAITIGENLSYSITDNPQVASQTEAGPIGYAMRMRPIVPVYDIMGNYAGTVAPQTGNAINPVSIVDRNRTTHNQSNRLFGNVHAQLNVLNNHLTVKTSFGGHYSNGVYHSFTYPQYSRSENAVTNAYNRSMSTGYDYTWTNTATYQQSIKGGHNIKLLVGMEAHKNQYSGMSGSTQDYYSFDPAFVNLSTGSGTQTNSSYHGITTLFSLFGRLNYNYKQTFLMSATLRRDGSSKFLNHRYGLFPAASVGWRISNEPFFHVSWINNLKLRAGYGEMGNQLNVNANNSYSLYSNSKQYSYYPVDASNSNLTLGFQKGRIGNPNAKWERDTNMNVGFDADMFNGGLSISASYYQKKIKGLLYNPSLPGAAGLANPPYVNVGRMSDNGLDISLKTLDHISSNLQINAKVTFTTYNNLIKKIAQGVKYFDQQGRRFNGSAIVRNAVGHPISSFFGYKITGFWNSKQELQKADAMAQQATGDTSAVYQTGEGLGRFRYKDVNGDGQITPADRTFLGNPNPNYTYGINFGLQYKGFDFSMSWYGSEGNKIWDNVKWWHDFADNFVGGKSKALLNNSWTPNHHNAALPINETTQTMSNNQVPNSFFVQNGSYLRLKNIEIGYSLPQSLLQRLDIQKLRFYVKGANLLTITPYPGIDPSVGYFPGTGGGTSTAFGIDSGTYPTLKKYLVGINLSF